VVEGGTLSFAIRRHSSPPKPLGDIARHKGPVASFTCCGRCDSPVEGNWLGRSQALLFSAPLVAVSETLSSDVRCRQSRERPPSLVTLGVKAAMDSTYANIAQGHHEVASLFVLLFGGSAIFGLILGLLTSGATGCGFRRKIRQLTDRVDAVANKEQAQSLIGGLKALDRRLGRQASALLNVILLLCTFIVVSIQLLDYENLAITYFQQSIAICRPYIEEVDETRLGSRFAQGRSREDYMAVISELRTVATRNRLRLLDFEPW